MIRYEFACDDCKVLTDHYLPMKDGPGSMDCPECGEKMRHCLGGNFILVGDGWAGKDLKSREYEMDKSREQNDAQMAEDSRKQRLVDEVMEVRRQGTEASRKLRENNPQKWKDYRSATKEGYRAKSKSYEGTVKPGKK